MNGSREQLSALRAVESDRRTDRRAGADEEPGWRCELTATAILVFPGPRSVLGGWAEWCAPTTGEYWTLSLPESGDACVVVRYTHPTPDWDAGGITAGDWLMPADTAPEIVAGAPGESGVRDDAEFAVLVLAHYDSTAEELRQLRTGALLAVPILDRAACLEPPEEEP